MEGDWEEGRRHERKSAKECKRVRKRKKEQVLSYVMGEEEGVKQREQRGIERRRGSSERKLIKG